MSTTPSAVVGDHQNQNSSNTAGSARNPSLVSRSATSDGGRASRLRSPAVAISRGFDLTRPYFDGGCPMPATPAVDPQGVPVESASGNAAGSPKLAVSASTGTRTMVDTVRHIAGAA